MKVGVNNLANVHIIMYLMERAYCCKELAELTGLGIWATREFVALLHTKKLVYIVRRGRYGQGGWNRRYFKWGPGEDEVFSPVEPSWKRKVKVREAKVVARERQIKELENV